MKKILYCKQLAYLVLVSFTVFFSFDAVAIAANESGDAIDALENNTADEEISGLDPYQHMFTITAYYSPLPGQEKYVTGSYSSDIRLNGNGTHGADGTPVYPGMVAAPSKYPFGTKLNIPGIGLVAVHDRGGAIVKAGQRNQSYDRLDIWMGYGDQGLKRALSWGKRNVMVTLYGLDPSKEEHVYLDGYSEAEKVVQNIITPTRLFPQDIWYGSTGSNVVKLQQTLQGLGYYNGPIDGNYEDTTKEAVYQFQKDQNLVSDESEIGAGHMGPQTRIRLEIALNDRRKAQLPKAGLSEGTQSEDVKKLQELLRQLGYDVQVTGIYDEQTIQTVLKFQKDHGIIQLESQAGAGYFGPQTLAQLTTKYLDLQQNTSVVFGKDFLAADLRIGDSGEDVLSLQKELFHLQFLRIEPTGYYGEVTEHAVFKFQQSVGLVGDTTSQGAGVIGPVTRDRMNRMIANRLYTKQRIVARTSTEGTLVATTKTSLLSAELDPGTTDSSVKSLQAVLQKLGYFKGGLISDFYGPMTSDAVLEFQLKEGIVESSLDTGAGRVGPKTLNALNTYISSGLIAA